MVVYIKLIISIIIFILKKISINRISHYKPIQYHFIYVILSINCILTVYILNYYSYRNFSHVEHLFTSIKLFKQF